MKWRYSMVIQWSDEDQVYVVTLPEFQGPHTHGATYEEASQRGLEALESLIEAYQAEGWPLPEPIKFGSSIYVAEEDVRSAAKAKKKRRKTRKLQGSKA